MRLEDLPEPLRRQAELQLGLASASKDTRKNAQSEHDTHEALEVGSCPEKISSPVCLVIVCYRTGIKWDLDNVSVKPFLDGIVERGLLEGDSTREIKAVLKIEERCKTKAEERTELEFWDAEYFMEYIKAARRARL